jgi:hypothetical protein
MLDDALGVHGRPQSRPWRISGKELWGEMTANERMNLGGEIADAAEASGGRTMRNAGTINQRKDENLEVTYRQTRPGRCASGRLSAHSQQQSWVPTCPMAGWSGSSCSQFSRRLFPESFLLRGSPVSVRRRRRSRATRVTQLVDESRSFAPGTPPPRLPPRPEMLFSWLLPGMRCDAMR